MVQPILALLCAATLLGSHSSGAEPDPLAAYRWEHRLLVLHLPDTDAGRKVLQAFRVSLDALMPEVIDRDLLVVPVGELPNETGVLRPTVVLSEPDRAAVRRQLGLRDGTMQLVLIGKDGGIKLRQSQGEFDLERVFAVIDTMPMRRAEVKP